MIQKKEPLAYRMSPRNLDEYVGQEEILEEGKLLYRMIKADRLTSIILWGPPGCGKSALAKVIAKTTKKKFERLNAVSSGVAEIKSIVSDAKNMLINPSGKVLVFIDEIHRFNKAQQDALLPYVEDGTIVLIGATTENPYFQVNNALLSRSTVFKLKPLDENDIKKVINYALKDKERGLGNLSITISPEIVEYLSRAVNGDARTALNALELAVLTSDMDSQGSICILKEVIDQCLQEKSKLLYDKNADGHYDNISAFIKSMRGSDPDAALFYLARALHSGEDPMFIARRIMICAAEDVGMANPEALVVAVSAANAVHMIGMPEARIILAEAVVMVAASPKSNSCYRGINQALDDVKNKDCGEVPLHLRNAPVVGLQKHGYGNDYKYAHDFDGNYVVQQYLPDKIKDTVYYYPSNNGYEKEININKEKENNQ